MKHDPFTLRVALDSSGTARGELYLDDGETYSHEKGDLVWREFDAKSDGKGLVITSKDLVHSSLDKAVDGVALATYNPKNAFANSIQSVKVERISILGLKSKPGFVKTSTGESLEWDWAEGVQAKGSKEGASSVLTIKNPGVHVVSDWSILIS